MLHRPRINETLSFQRNETRKFEKNVYDKNRLRLDRWCFLRALRNRLTSVSGRQILLISHDQRSNWLDRSTTITLISSSVPYLIEPCHNIYLLIFLTCRRFNVSSLLSRVNFKILSSRNDINYCINYTRRNNTVNLLIRSQICPPLRRNTANVSWQTVLHRES